jgi:hypothetical protein
MWKAGLLLALTVGCASAPVAAQNVIYCAEGGLSTDRAVGFGSVTVEEGRIYPCTPEDQLSDGPDAGFEAEYFETANGRGWVINCSASTTRCVTDFDGGSPVLIRCPAGEVCMGSGADQRLP